MSMFSSLGALDAANDSTTSAPRAALFQPKVKPRARKAAGAASALVKSVPASREDPVAPVARREDSAAPVEPREDSAAPVDPREDLAAPVDPSQTAGTKDVSERETIKRAEIPTATVVECVEDRTSKESGSPVNDGTVSCSQNVQSMPPTGSAVSPGVLSPPGSPSDNVSPERNLMVRPGEPPVAVRSKFPGLLSSEDLPDHGEIARKPSTPPESEFPDALEHQVTKSPPPSTSGSAGYETEQFAAAAFKEGDSTETFEAAAFKESDSIDHREDDIVKDFEAPAFRESDNAEGYGASVFKEGESTEDREATAVKEADSAIEETVHVGEQEAGAKPVSGVTTRRGKKRNFTHSTSQPRGVHSERKEAEISEKIDLSRTDLSNPAKLTMREIIRRAEAIERKKLKSEGTKKSATVHERQQKQPEAPAGRDAVSLAPQVQVIDGRIVINEQSLTIGAYATSRQNTETYMRVEENASRLNYSSYSTRTPVERWKKEDTDLFYVALQQFGTDFELIQNLFQGRTRRQVKAKFKKEERHNPRRLQAALAHRPKDQLHYTDMITRLQSDDHADQSAEDPFASILDYVERLNK